jgi:hypothetical protein
MEWEYHLWLPVDPMTALEQLNELGYQGWEAVCTLATGELLLKRPAGIR